MVRKLGIKGTIQPTSKRIRAVNLRAKKESLGIDCFFSVGDTSTYIDDEIEI